MRSGDWRAYLYSAEGSLQKNVARFSCGGIRDKYRTNVREDLQPDGGLRTLDLLREMNRKSFRWDGSTERRGSGKLAWTGLTGPHLPVLRMIFGNGAPYLFDPL